MFPVRVLDSSRSVKMTLIMPFSQNMPFAFEQRFFLGNMGSFLPKLQFHDHKEVDFGMLQSSHCSNDFWVD